MNTFFYRFSRPMSAIRSVESSASVTVDYSTVKDAGEKVVRCEQDTFSSERIRILPVSQG